MKVLYVDPIRLPTEKAHGIQIMEMCAALKRAGVDVELVVSDRKTPITENPFTFYDIKETFPIIRVHAPDLIAFGPLGFSVFLWVFSRRALRHAQKSDADAIYTRTPDVAKLFVERYSGAVAWEVHSRQRNPKKMLARLGLLVPITKGLARWYEAQGMPRERIHVAPDGVNLAGFAVADRKAARTQLRQRLGLPADARIALYLGSFGVYSWKGIDIARSAAQKLPEVTWLFVGGSDKECEEFTRGAPNNVRTLPRAKRSEIAQLLTGADVLLLPNKKGTIASEQDTSPLKLFEYMASGVPIVASDLPSIREALDERTSFFVLPNDPDALATAVRNAVTKPAESAAKASTAQEYAKHYTWDERAARILKSLRAA